MHGRTREKEEDEVERRSDRCWRAMGCRKGKAVQRKGGGEKYVRWAYPCLISRSLLVLVGVRTIITQSLKDDLAMRSEPSNSQNRLITVWPDRFGGNWWSIRGSFSLLARGNPSSDALLATDVQIPKKRFACMFLAAHTPQAPHCGAPLADTPSMSQ